MSQTDRAARIQDAVFAAFGEDATWQGVSDPVRVRRFEADERGDLGFGGSAIVTGRMIRVRASDVAEPAKGEEVQILDKYGEPIAGALYVVTGDPTMDRNRVWSCPVEPVPEP